MPDAGLLDETTVVSYLQSRGVLERDRPASVEALKGGVSNVVLRVRTVTSSLVLKQALPRLRVKVEWRAPRSRSLIEANALRLAGQITPDEVPAVVDADRRRHTVTTTDAGAELEVWKARLLDGEADEAVAEQLGAVLGAWHAATLHDERVRREFGGGAFEALRVAPFYRTTAKRHPELAEPILAAAEGMSGRRARCLVHGDFSPKNVLVGGPTVTVVDFEVAHYGDPVFDLAFLVHHLMLKAVHRPASLPAYQAASTAFLAAYAGAGGDRDDCDGRYLVQHVGCLLLARIDGKSPVEYLTLEQRAAARSAAIAVLRARVPNLAVVWKRIEEVAAGC